MFYILQNKYIIQKAPTAIIVDNIAICEKPSLLMPISVPKIEFLKAFVILFSFFCVRFANLYVFLAFKFKL